MFQIIFLLITLSKSIKEKYIKLPFYTINHYVSKDPKTLIKENFYNDIYTYIKVGSKSEKIPVSIKLQSYPFYILGENLKSDLNKDIFHQSKSKTYKSNLDFYAYGGEDFMNGTLSNDKIYFDNIENNLDFVLAKTLNEKMKVYQGGSLGFKLHNINSAKIQNVSLINLLKENKLISKKVFSFNYYDSNEKGDLIIGLKQHEINENYLEDDFISCKAKIAEGEIIWGYEFNNITIDGKEISKSNSKLVEFRIEYNYIVAGLNIFREYENVFFNQQGQKCHKDLFQIQSKSEFYFYYCDSDVDIKQLKILKFENKELNYTFNFTYEDLFIKYDGKYYFQIVVSKYESEDWYFGKPFFKKYSLTFDSDAKSFGLYTKYKKEGFFSKLFSTFFTTGFFLIIAIIIIFGLIYYIYFNVIKKNRRKRANELIDDNYEYISHD
jgi:hypothetical protein